MTALQLPAHLQGRQATGAAARATEGMGSSLPPHISIQGNKFTFIDGSGQESSNGPMLLFDGYIVDISDHINKRYYDKPFDQSAKSYEPPACWSANGLAPSREAAKPQASRCDLCEKNERGSAVSLMSGAAIKACRDERWVAVMNPAFGNMVFQLIVSPGSFKNWKAFMAQIENYKVDPQWVLTRFSFEDKTNGVLQFTLVNWTTPEALAVIDAALAEKKTDLIVGRLDQPRTAALPGPAQPTAAAIPPIQYTTTNPEVPQGFGVAPGQPNGGPAFTAQQEVIPPGAPQAPFGAPNAGFPSMTTAPPSPPLSGFQATATSAGGSPSEPAPAAQAQPATRRRRNSAASAAPAQPALAGAPVAPFAPGPAPQAPFGAQPAMQNANPTTPGAFTAAPPPGSAAGPSNNFGIGGGAQVDPAMSAMLANIFKAPGT